MRLTIDSNEPLEQVLRTIGAMYGVEVALAESDGAAVRPSAGRRRGSTSGRRGRRPSARRGSDTAAIRAWAQANGLAVSDRGRIPAGIAEAYRAAH